MFKLDDTVVKAELDSQECKRGILQAKYVYLNLRLQSFESLTSIEKQLEREDLAIFIREIDEVAQKKDGFDDAALLSGVKQLQK